MIRIVCAALCAGIMLSCESSDSGDPQPPIPPVDLYDWTKQRTLTLKALKDIYFIDNNFGWAVGENLVLTTPNGGTSWEPAPLDSSYEPDIINGIFFINQQRGWMAGSNQDSEEGDIFITAQGGAYPVLQQTYNHPLTSIHFIDAQQGWAAGIAGKVVKTTNAGMEWNDLVDLGVDLYDIHFTTDMKGWVAGDDGMLFKTQDGVNFDTEDLGTSNRLNAIHFTDTLNGWVCGINNTIYRRHTDSNNQIIWSNVTVVQASDVVEWKDIFFINPTTGWVVGEEGNIYKTTDGGQNWDKERVDTAENLNSIFMFTSTIGWIAGDEGLIFTYTP